MLPVALGTDPCPQVSCHCDAPQVSCHCDAPVSANYSLSMSHIRWTMRGQVRCVIQTAGVVAFLETWGQFSLSLYCASCLFPSIYQTSNPASTSPWPAISDPLRAWLCSPSGPHWTQPIPQDQNPARLPRAIYILFVHQSPCCPCDFWA